MKHYEIPEAKVILLEENDIITNSQSDNLGGTPEIWG